MVDWVTCDKCGGVNNADNYNKAMKEWNNQTQSMYMTYPPRWRNPPPKFICEICGAEV